MVRPGLNDMGRYHLWIDAWTFTDRRSGDTALFLGRRLEPAAKGNSYEIIRIGADGTYTVRHLSRSQRAESYPIFRTVQFLSDHSESVYNFSLTNVWPSIVVPILYPWISSLIGMVLLMVGIRRARTARM
jgi:hypothetical protein